MTIEMMKDFLKSRYPTSEWAKKVELMADAQIIAIYKRLQAADPPTRVHAVLRRLAYTVYGCYDCGKFFEADNPELTECRFCGSKDIYVDNTFTRVRKE